MSNGKNKNKMHSILFKLASLFFFLMLLIFGQSHSTCNESTSELELDIKNDSEAILSRRKRFLIFPEGSSVQLVFCCTFPNVSPLGDIALWGYTAALAYELPQDPYSPFNHHADPLHRRGDAKTIYFTDEKGRVLFKKPYKRKPIVNPAFAKRSVDARTDTLAVEADKFEKRKQENLKIDRKQMHASRHKREFLKSEHMERGSVEFHRSSRTGLYRKVETLFDAHGANGRSCLLKTLCIIGQTRNDKQGEFLEEILRAIFTLPRGNFVDQLEDYDAAHSVTGSCDSLYPDCEHSLSDPSEVLTL